MHYLKNFWRFLLINLSGDDKFSVVTGITRRLKNNRHSYQLKSILILMITNAFILLPAVIRAQDAGMIIHKTVPDWSKLKHFSLPEKRVPDSSLNSRLLQRPAFTFPTFSRPFISFTRGAVDYSYYFRSQVDTPFLQKNLYQHQVNTAAAITVGNLIPLRVSTLVRRSNSLFFKDITDMQAEFDAQAFQQKIYSNALKNVEQAAANMRDSLSGLLAQLKTAEYLRLNEHFNHEFTIQQLAEANELLNVPALTWDKNLSDSAASIKSDSIRHQAAAFIQLYNDTKVSIDNVKGLADSVTRIYHHSLAAVQQLRSISSGKISSYDQFKEYAGRPEIRNQGIELIPTKYRWLLGIRKFVLGKSPMNYSDLTAKNNSINGINFEYNTWYYLAFTAGLLDFHFRDFALSGSEKYKQHLIMGRLGIGNINKSFLVFSVFNGSKQTFTQGATSNFYHYNITGISVEAKYQFSRYGYLKVEAGESLGPDFSKTPLQNTKWNLKEKEDKAFSIAAHLAIPKTQSNFDASFKHTGANYQSFNTFQTSSSLTAFNVKWDQYFFRKQLRFTAAVRRNDFSNPYIIQQYSNNTIFKSLQTVLRRRGWPVLSVAYMPVSQLTSAGGNIYENKFNSLNTTLYHSYRIEQVKMLSTVMLNRFYNQSGDTSFIYFNSKNLMLSQLFMYTQFSVGISLSQNINRNYHYSITEEHVQVPFKKRGSVMIGLKLYHLNAMESLLGSYASWKVPLNRTMSISMFYECGYIPGMKGTLVKNQTGNFQLSKIF
jgi:hypothetical protein